MIQSKPDPLRIAVLLVYVAFFYTISINLMNFLGEEPSLLLDSHWILNKQHGPANMSHVRRRGHEEWTGIPKNYAM